MAAEGRGVAAVAFSASSVQAGAALGATLFPLIGPIGVTAVRQAVAGVVLLAVTRPPLRRLGLRRLAPALLLGAVLVGMNFCLYSAVERIGLGLAVTIEFLGPLAVALAASGTGRVAGKVLAATLALGGIVLLTDPFTGAVVEPVGILFGLTAACCWAGYIVLSDRLGALPGITGSAVASATGALFTLPFLVVLLLRLPAERLPQVLLVGVATGVLSNALPYPIDLVVLRRMPRALFGMLQSLHPVAAAVFGFLVLGQMLAGPQLGGIAAVCTANVLAVRSARRR